LRLAAEFAMMSQNWRWAMKRCLLALIVAGVVFGTPPLEAVTRVRVVHRGPRTTIVVHRGFPLRRALPPVFVLAPRAAIRVAPLRYLAPVVWAPVVVAAPAARELAWEERQELAAENEWTDFALSAGQTGRRLYLEVEGGPVALNFAEVVFANGDTQVVDLGERPRDPGVYSLLDLGDGRMVDHVRMVARVDNGTARVVLRISR
jgi:hypothetical protein